MSISFSTPQIMHNFCDWKIHPVLTDLICWIEDFTGEIVITSAKRFRTVYKKDSGIHTTDPLRAVDLRYYIYNNPIKLCEIINENWRYDRVRPHLKCAVLHDVGMGMHFHIQVHDRTRPN